MEEIKANESELLERVFMRLGNAGTDHQLEEFMKKFLTPVLLKLASRNEDVKKKVLELLAQINRILKSRECVQLPMEELFLQYQDPKCTMFVRNFTIIYLKMGYPRLNPDNQLMYLPRLFSSMQGKPQPQQMCLLQLAIPVLAMFCGENTSLPMKDLHSVIIKTKAIQDFFLNFILDIIILPYGAITNDPKNCDVPSGLSRVSFQQLMSTSINLDNLESIKLGILKFLSSDLFDTPLILIHLVVATGDSHHTICEYASHQIKRITDSSHWEHFGVMNRLLSIFLGTINLPGKPEVPLDESRKPASISLKLKIFPFLLKSRKCADIFPACLQVVFQADQIEFKNQAKHKLKKFKIQFIHHLCEFSSDKVMGILSPILLSTLMKMTVDNDGEEDAERITFLAVGKIAKRSPLLFHKDATVLQNLFQALNNKDVDTCQDIIEAMSMIAKACKQAASQTLALIEALILDNVSQENPQSRLAAVKVANILFPSDHVKSRYVCLLASGDVRNDIREECNRGLLLNQLKQPNDTFAFPNFCEMVMFVHQSIDGGNGRYKQSYLTSAGSLPHSPLVFMNILQYLERCLKFSSEVSQEDEDNDRELIPISKYVQSIVKNQVIVIHKYLAFIREALKPSGNNELHAVALKNLLAIISSAPVDLMSKLNETGLSWIKNFIWSSNSVVRDISANIFAILICLSGKEIILQELTGLMTSINDSSDAVQCGTINCLGHLIGQYLGKENFDNQEKMELDDIEVSEMTAEKITKCISGAFTAIIQFLLSKSTYHVLTCCDATGEVCRQGSMPLLDGVLTSNNDKNKQEILNKADVINQLTHIMNNSKEQKLSEKAAQVLGMICIGEESSIFVNEIAERLFATASIKRDIDFQFTVGEALSCVGAGGFSSALRSKWRVGTGTSDEIPGTKKTMLWLLGRIMNEFIISDIASVRKASCVWLLVILKHSGQHSAVQETMASIQKAFSAMLSENDEIVQEVSSKGLSLIYEYGTEEFRKDIVSSLVETMLFNKKKVQNITAETKLFDNAMPLGDSGQLSTYKELCSLASDMNQPELVYRFLHLANHNAMWNSKKGAAFGFASIAAQAKKELEPHLKTLVPKLYRYQFDPNSKVREAMLSIWHAIVKEQHKVVDKYSGEILDELLANLHSTVWRVRQSCCVAVGNFLNGRSLDGIMSYLPQLWTMCLRDMDDIKETVRNAASVACKTLQSVSVRSCDVNQGKIGQESIRVLLPVLLEQGIASRVDDVRKLVLDTVVKISKNAGSLLKPHIPVLVTTLLEALSGLEPQQLNYLSLQVHKDADLQEKLEDARISFSKSSPMMQTVSLCVQHVDSDVLIELVPRITELLRGGLGLGTKAGCAGFVVSLVQHCGQDLQPHAGKLLSALLSGLNDRSQAICKKYAEAIGSLVKVAKDNSVSKLFAKMKSWYFEKESSSLQNACGLVCKEISRSSPDVISHHAAAVLPLAFVAMHRKESADGKKTPWNDIWTENTPVSSRGILLYLHEIIVITTTLLSGQSWQRKVEAAKCIQTIVITLNKDFPKQHLDGIIAALVSGLAGRTWDGKESIVDCVGIVFVQCHSVLNDDTCRVIANAVLKECRKQNIPYKSNAIKCLGQILHEKNDVVVFEDVYDILKPIVNPEKKKDDNDEKSEEEEEEITDVKLLINSFECLGFAWPVDKSRQIAKRHEILHLLASSLKNHPWKVQLSILSALIGYVNKVSDDEDAEFLGEIFLISFSELYPCLENLKYAAIRLKSLDLAHDLLLLVERTSFVLDSEHKEKVRELYRVLAILRNDNNENVKSKSLKLDVLVKKYM